MLIKLELQVTFQHTNVGLILLNILFFLGLLLSGTNYIQILEMHLSQFLKHLLKEIRPDPHSVYKICKPIGVKLLTRLGLSLNHHNEHRFNHNFENCINPLCTCSLETETISHFFLHCHYCHPCLLTK